MKTWRFLVLISLLLSLALLVSCGGSDDEKKASVPKNDNPGGISDDDAADDDTTADDDDDTSSDEINVVMITRNVSDVPAYETMLESYKLRFSSILEDEIATTDFSSADVLFVDTSCRWYSAADVTTIDETGLPILGVFEGGGYLFNGLGLYAGWDNGFTEFDVTDTVVQDASHPVFTKPYGLNVTNGETIALFASGVRLHYLDALDAPADVTLLANRPVGTDYSGIVLQKKIYIYWGYEMSPNLLTANGAKLLINSLYYLAGVGNANSQ
ncbi:MAG: hypothetical protein GX444_18085 [Myxococcales bacterium]|nr:hypothetical protein [Myxococcales bacterium]